MPRFWRLVLFSQGRYDLHHFLILFFSAECYFSMLLLFDMPSNFNIHRKLPKKRRYTLLSQRWGLSSLKLHRISAKMLGSNSSRQKARLRRYALIFLYSRLCLQDARLDQLLFGYRKNSNQLFVFVCVNIVPVRNDSITFYHFFSHFAFTVWHVYSTISFFVK